MDFNKDLTTCIGIVYKIINNINNKSYIGQTFFSFFERYKNGRWWKITDNISLKRAAKKYGPENFRIEILYKNITNQLELDMLETLSIKEHKTLSPNGYNFQSGGKKYFTISKTLKNRNNKIIYKIKSPTGEIFEFKCISDFCKKNNLSISGVSQLLNKKINRFKQWTRYDFNAPLKKIVSPTGEVFIIKYGEFEKFCKEHGLHHFGIRQVLNGNFAQFKGWIKYNEQTNTKPTSSN